MTYSVKEIYSTLQGEGAQSGRAAVFCRFAGCNLWSGLERDRSTAICQFCDTDFVGTDGPGGGKFADARSLAGRIVDCWESRAGIRGIDSSCSRGENPPCNSTTRWFRPYIPMGSKSPWRPTAPCPFRRLSIGFA